ncbi:MAG: hypothetical protein R6X20_08815 [Phycisphaerae bacterium]
MSRYLLVFAAFTVLTAAPVFAEAPAADARTHGPNLVTNPGFESEAEGWRVPDGHRVVQGAAARSGGFFLAAERTDPQVYRLATQVVPCKPGRAYRFSAWVRAKDVAGKDTGAAVCMEWSGEDGWIGGTYPAGVKGTTGWTRIEGITPPVPDETTRVTVTVYLRPGMTGEAWFDDVSVREYRGRPMEAFLLDPPYRGLIFDGAERRPIRVHVSLADRIQGHDWNEGEGYADLSDLALVARLLVPGETLAEKRITDFSERSMEVELDAEPLPVGTYRVDVSLVCGEEVLARRALDGRVLAKGDRPRVYIDRHGRTIVRGRPFFPLGFYFSTLREGDLKTLSRAGFNCAMPYAFSRMDPGKAGDLLDMAHRHGIKVIYSIKDLYAGMRYTPGWLKSEEAAAARVRRVVERFRSHPAVLAWYLNDELPPPWRERLEDRYRLVRRLDPDHPTWAVLYQVDQLAEYRHTCDVLGTDPYPVARSPVATAGEWARKTREASLGTDAVWQVPQAFAWCTARKDRDPQGEGRPPTYAELRCMTYQALAEGAKGLIYYAFYELKEDPLGFDARWKDMTRIAREVRALEPALLSADPPPEAVEVEGARGRAFRDGRRAWILVTNPRPEPAAMRIRFGGGVRSVQTMTGRAVPVEGGRIAQTLEPLACETFIAELP